MHFHFFFVFVFDIKKKIKKKKDNDMVDLLPWTKKKKEPSPSFAARRTLFDLVISCAIRSDQRRARPSATVRDFCPALISRGRP